MKKLWIILWSILLLLSSAVPAGAAEAKTLTLMVYVTGSDLESSYGSATADIREMIAAGVNDSDVTVLLLTGGSASWDLGFDASRLTVSELGSRGMRIVDRLADRSMGDPATLSQFLALGAGRYPAENYALILWDHGAGPMNGLCYDELHGGDWLTLTELDRALADSPFGEGNKLSWIGFDACLMNSVETASICAPYAEYMIASQETEPASGWNYAFLRDIEGDPDGAATGRRVIESYFDAGDESSALTLACLDLAQIPAVEAGLDALFTRLDGLMDVKSFSDFSNHRRNARAFGRGSTGSEYDLVDLLDLAEQYAPAAPEEAAALCRAVESAVVWEGSSLERANGLSLYYPYFNKDHFLSQWQGRYTDLDFASGYRQYMDDYTTFWLGEALADFSDLTATGVFEAEQGVQELALSLTEDQAEHFAYAEVTIISEMSVSDGFHYVYTLDDVELGEDNTLRASYDYQALYLMDGEGQPLSEPLPFTIIEDSYFIPARLETCSFEDTMNAIFTGDREDLPEFEVRAVLLRCRRDPETDELQILGIVEDTEDLAMGKQLTEIDTEKWTWMNFSIEPYALVRDERGQIRPYSEWPALNSIGDGIYFVMNEYPIDGAWSLRFRSVQTDGQNLYAQFTVHDTQGEVFASELLSVENPNVSTRYDTPYTVLDIPEARVTLTSVEAVASRTGSGVYLRFDVENRMEDRWLTLSLDNLLLNGSWNPFISNYPLDSFAPGKSQSVYLQLEPQKLPPMEGRKLRRMDFTLLAKTSLGESDFDYQELAGAEVELWPALTLDEELVRDTGELRAFAEGENGEISFQLMELSEEENGDLSGLLCITNYSKEPFELYSYSMSSALNGCYFMKNVSFPGGVASSIRVLPDTDTYIPISIGSYTPAKSIFSDDNFQRTDGIAHWQIRELDRLTLIPWYLSDAPQPISLTFSNAFELRPREDDLPPGVLLADTEALRLTLRSASVSDGTLTLDFDTENTGGRDLTMSYMDAVLDGKTVTLKSSMENSEWNSIFGKTLPLEADIRCRAQFQIQLPKGRSPRQLEITLLVEPEGGEEYLISPFRIEFPDFDASSDESLSPDRLIVTPGEQQEPGYDLHTLFTSPLPVSAPEAAPLRASVSLTEEQLAAGDSVTAVLLQDRGESYAILTYGITTVNGRQISAEFPPYLVGPINSSGELFLPLQTLRRQDGQWSYDLITGMLYTVYERYQSLDHLILSWEEGEDHAQVEEVVVEGEALAAWKYSWVRFMAWDRLATRDAAGQLLHINDWNWPNGYRGQLLLPDIHGRRELRMLPLREIDGLCVVFSIWNSDGSGYSLGPVPLA